MKRGVFTQGPQYSLITLGALGSVVAGVSWDAVLHARDPFRFAHEGLLTLANPAHALIAIGVAAAIAAQFGAAIVHLRTVRSRLAVTAVSIAILTAATVACAWSWTVQADQDRAAERLIADTRAGISPYRDWNVAFADGYRPATPASWPIVEWVNPVYTLAGRVLDVRRPERLMYLSGARGPILAGAMFVMPSTSGTAPAVGGARAHWHRHYDLCYLATGAIAGTNSYGFPCPAGSAVRPTPEMLHIWIVDNPAGPFADDLPLPTIARIIAGA